MKKKLKILWITVCGAIALGGSTVAATNIYNANAETELVLPAEYTVATEYVYGETFAVPDPSEVRIETGTLTTNAVSVALEYPDGTTRSEGEYTLDKTGVYRITYYNANGVSASQSFVVNKSYYELGANSSATYVESLAGKEGTGGISVALKSGESFSFNKTVDLNDYAGEVLDVCKIYPKFRKEYDVDPAATTVSVKIVDCYDPSKFVEFYVWCGSAGNAPYYAGAGTSEQTLTGFEQNSNRPQEMTVEYEGEMYKIHRARRYQSLSTFGRWLASRYDDELVKQDGISLLWDTATHQMKAKNNGTTYLITDIDSPEVYGTNLFDFDSFFTTGEVLLNIEAYNYAATEFNLEIESVFDMSGEELLNGVVLDEEAPQIFVDVETTKENSVYLQKGVEAVLPKISNVRDYNYYGNESVAVYRNYGKQGQASVKVKDGAFIPETAGNYTAVYSAVDSYGNRGEYLLELIVVEKENISFAEKKLEKLVAASSNTLPYIEASGLNKEVSVGVTVTTPDGREIALEYNGVDGYDYLPEYVGNYTVTYIFEDNVYTKAYSYEVACVDENAATFKQPFVFSSHFIKGASYTVYPVFAYTAGNGGLVANEAAVSVSVDGGAYKALSASEMASYKVEAHETLRFKASYGDNAIESETYSVVDVGYGKKTTEKDYLSYMQGNYTSAELAVNAATYTFAGGNAEMRFINAVSSANFKLGFTLSAFEAETLTVVLRDIRDPENNYITYTYQKEGSSNVTFEARQYKDGKLILENNAYTSHKTWNGEYLLTYSSEGLNVDGALVSGIKTFATDLAILEITATGGVADWTFALSQLNNQTFSQTIRESKPQMAYGQINGVQEVNGIYEIQPCYANAVLETVLAKDVKLTVTAPNGEVASSTDGLRLEGVTADRVYGLKLTQIGQYRIVYEVSCLGATRTNGQEVLSNDDYYIVNVSEGIAPTIEFKDGSNSKTTVHVKLGSTHKIKEFTAADNMTAAEKLRTYTMILDDRFMLEANGYDVDSYTFKNTGNYLVYVLVYDELGNSASLYYNVVVS